MQQLLKFYQLDDKGDFKERDSVTLAKTQLCKIH